MATQDHSETNVTELKPKKGKLSSHDMVTSLISAMDKCPLAALSTGILDERFEVMPEPRGTGVQPLLVYPNGECIHLTPTHAAQILLHFVRSKVKKGWPITERICQEAFFQWVACRREKAIKTPIKQVSFHSQDSLCWKKLDFDPKDMPTPVFDEILSRISAPKEFQAFIGSIFVEESDRSQFLWIFGEGANGKSRILAFLQNILGDNCSPQTAPTSQTERWFKAGLVGKRLALFADCSNTKFTQSDLFKNLTGDDVHSVERKGLPLSNEVLRPKFLFMSNAKPKVQGDKAGRRRAMTVEIEAVRGDKISSSLYDQKLIREASGVVWGCLRAYEEMTKHHSEIEIGDVMNKDVEKAIEENYEEMEATLEKYFDIDFESDKIHWVTARILMETLKEQKLDGRERSEMKAYLRTKGVVKVQIWEDGRNVHKYQGLVENGLVSGRSGYQGMARQGSVGAGVSSAF